MQRKQRLPFPLLYIEADAAYKLAAALSNYDADELKNLQFLEIQLKNDPKKPKKSDKNFIEVNKKQMR